VVNPPGGKYNHFINEALPEDPDEWFGNAAEIAGSWWPDWQRWVTSFDKSEVAARIPGSGPLPAIEDAPGSYVMVRS
jgi:polyhydroxyalkanoate synthase